MNSKHTKIIVDILMTIFLILSFVRWDGTGGAVYHITVGSICAVLFAIHIFIHRKWIKAVTKSCFARKISKNLQWIYIVNILLMVVWAVSIVTGIIAMAPFFGEIEEAFPWGRLHGVAARIGLALIIIHIIQHIPQIKSYMGIKKK